MGRRMNLPAYVGDVPRSRLIQVECRGGCGPTRYHEVSRLPWSRDEKPSPDLFATCLNCGKKTRDNYNWREVR